MDKASFLVRFGGVYEHSPWVAGTAYDAGAERDVSDAGALSDCFEKVFMTTSSQRQMTVLRAHPELACAQAKFSQLTSASQDEQSGAGLNQCSAEEFGSFKQLNADYGKKFGFPFIIAVKGRKRQEILQVFQARLNNDEATEFQTALKQVCRIARIRIGDILDG